MYVRACVWGGAGGLGAGVCDKACACICWKTILQRYTSAETKKTSNDLAVDVGKPPGPSF